MSDGYTKGPWSWTIHDHSMASLGSGEWPGMGTPLVMDVGPCEACAERADPKEWKWGRCCTPSLADATLIAAAPCLLEALEGSQMLLSVALIEAQKADDSEFCVRLKARLKMQAEIIAKAKGE